MIQLHNSAVAHPMSSTNEHANTLASAVSLVPTVDPAIPPPPAISTDPIAFTLALAVLVGLLKK